MNIQFFSILFHLIFFGMGAYLYLFAVGYIKTSEKGEEFRKDNANWLKYFSMALAGIMLVNLFLDLFPVK